MFTVVVAFRWKSFHNDVEIISTGSDRFVENAKNIRPFDQSMTTNKFSFHGYKKQKGKLYMMPSQTCAEIIQNVLEIGNGFICAGGQTPYDT